MESVLGRYRNLIILVGVLFLQVLGLATQVKRSGNDAESTRLIRIWVVGAITPFERGVIWIENGTGNLWHNYFYLRGVRAENRQLKDQIEQMRLEQVRLSEDAAQAHRLQTLLAFKEQFISSTVAAQVIGSSGSDLSRIVYIDKGENAGIKKDMAVITADGIVGKVLVVYPSVAQVLVINDQTSGVGAILEKSRLQGYLKGRADGEIGMVGVMSDEQVAPGETSAHQRRRPDFSQGIAGWHGHEGHQRQGFVSEHQRETGRRSEQAGRSAGAGREAGERNVGGRYHPRARCRHSGTTPAVRARQARYGSEGGGKRCSRLG